MIPPIFFALAIGFLALVGKFYSGGNGSNSGGSSSDGGGSSCGSSCGGCGGGD